MCLAVPGKIISIDESNEFLKMARVDFNSNVREVCIEWLPEAGIGDYVLVHVGTAISKIDEEDAKNTLEALREMGELIEEEDSKKGFTNVS